MSTPARGNPAIKVGVVASNKMTKSVVVEVQRVTLEPRYKRYVRRTSRFMAHDEAATCKVGDRVEIVECRPLSARKRWRVRRVLRTAVTAAEWTGEGSAT